jgi:uncharacterized membrane protein (DUF4010 family)
MTPNDGLALAPAVHWPYAPTFLRLALALAIGMFVGIERERRRKEAGLRTFAFAALLGAIGGLLGDPFALATLGLVGILIVLLNFETIRTGEGAELTTSAALVVTTFVGILAGQGHTFTPTVLGVVTAALLAWKEPLVGFTRTLTEGELRSAVLLAILAFVVYPVLPTGSVDTWHLVDPREAWVTVILIAALGFMNYILLKLYGDRGLAVMSFLGGLVNSTAAVADLANRAEGEPPATWNHAIYRGALLGTAAMLLRNAVILALLAPLALGHTLIPFVMMFAGATVLAFVGGPRAESTPGDPVDHAAAPSTLQSPFSLSAALKFGLVFLALQVGGTLAERALGDSAFYVVSAVGGLISSASAVASSAALSASGTLSPQTAGLAAMVASLTSALVTVPLVSRLVRRPPLTRRIGVALVGLYVLGAVGAVIQSGVMAAFGAATP